MPKRAGSTGAVTPASAWKSFTSQALSATRSAAMVSGDGSVEVERFVHVSVT